MTLARPAYKVTVENITAGWSYTATQGDDSTLGDTVQLADGFSMGWAFKDGYPANQLDPEQLTFNLRAPTATDLPATDIGDLLKVVLERPLTVGTAGYMTFYGRVTDADITPRVKLGPLLTITGTGVTSTSPLVKDSGGVWNAQAGPMESPLRIGRLAAISELNLFDPFVTGEQNYEYDLGAVTIDGRPALEVMVEVLQSIGWVNAQVMRGFYGEPNSIWTSYGHLYCRSLGEFGVVIAEYGSEYAEGDRLWFLSQQFFDVEVAIVEHGDAPYQLVLSSGKLTVTYTGLDTTDDRQMSAGLVELPSTKWHKDRDAGNNSILYQGIDTEVVTAYPDLVEKYGENQRTIDTQVSDFGVTAFRNGAEAVRPPFAYLPDPDDALSKYRVDSLVIRTDFMTDAELDRYASTFWPVIDETTVTESVRRLYLVDLDERFLVGGVALVAKIVGCTFRIAGGKLSIEPTLSFTTPTVATIDDAVTWAQLNTAYPTKKWTDVDPNLTWADVALASI